MLPKRLSTHRRPLHASPTLRSETVTRMAHQAAANPTQSFAVPALHLEAASVVRTGRRSRNKVLPAGRWPALLWCLPSSVVSCVRQQDAVGYSPRDLQRPDAQQPAGRSVCADLPQPPSPTPPACHTAGVLLCQVTGQRRAAQLHGCCSAVWVCQGRHWGQVRWPTQVACILCSVQGWLTCCAVQMQVCEDVVLCQRTLPGVAGQAALFCVFDGHNGRSAADEAAHLLPKTLTQHLQVCPMGLLG